MEDHVAVYRFVVDEHYSIIQKWWEFYGSFAPRVGHLPKTGFVIAVDNVLSAAGFLYRTDSGNRTEGGICVFEFAICNPEIAKKSRDVALTELIKRANEWAHLNKFDLIYTSTSNPKFISRLKVAGFIEADKNQTHLFK